MSAMSDLHLCMMELTEAIDESAVPFSGISDVQELTAQTGYTMSVTTDWIEVKVLIMLVNNGQVVVAVQNDRSSNWCEIYPAGSIKQDEVIFEVGNQLTA